MPLITETDDTFKAELLGFGIEIEKVLSFFGISINKILVVLSIFVLISDFIIIPRRWIITSKKPSPRITSGDASFTTAASS